MCRCGAPCCSQLWGEPPSSFRRFPSHAHSPSDACPHANPSLINDERQSRTRAGTSREVTHLGPNDASDTRGAARGQRAQRHHQAGSGPQRRLASLLGKRFPCRGARCCFRRRGSCSQCLRRWHHLAPDPHTHPNNCSRACSRPMTCRGAPNQPHDSGACVGPTLQPRAVHCATDVVHDDEHARRTGASPQPFRTLTHSSARCGRRKLALSSLHVCDSPLHRCRGQALHLGEGAL